MAGSAMFGPGIMSTIFSIGLALIGGLIGSKSFGGSVNGMLEKAGIVDKKPEPQAQGTGLAAPGQTQGQIQSQTAGAVAFTNQEIVAAMQASSAAGQGAMMRVGGTKEKPTLLPILNLQEREDAQQGNRTIDRGTLAQVQLGCTDAQGIALVPEGTDKFKVECVAGPGTAHGRPMAAPAPAARAR